MDHTFGRLEVSILVAILLTITGFWIFGLIAEKVMEGNTDRFDDRILFAMRQPGALWVPFGPHWTLQVAQDVSAFGGAFGIGLVTAVVSGYLALQRRYGLLVFVLASIFTGTLVAVTLKHLFNRPRPQVVPHLTAISTASFPSGHSMMSSVVYLTIAALLARAVPDMKTKIYFLAVALFLIVLIGCSRVYLGVHYPTDVLAGWCLGCTWAVLCSLSAHLLSRNRALPRSEELADRIPANAGDENPPPA